MEKITVLDEMIDFSKATTLRWNDSHREEALGGGTGLAKEFFASKFSNDWYGRLYAFKAKTDIVKMGDLLWYNSTNYYTFEIVKIEDNGEVVINFTGVQTSPAGWVIFMFDVLGRGIIFFNGKHFGFS